MVDRHGKRWDDDIVSARGIVRVEAKRISGWRADQSGIEPAEFAVHARISKRVNELSCCDFDLDRARLGRHEAILRPRFTTGNRQADKDDQSDDCPEDFHRDVSVREARALSAIAESENGIREAQLREDERGTGDVKRKDVLPINERSGGSNWRRWRKQMSRESVDGREDQQSQKKCQQKSWCCGATGLLPASNHNGAR